MDLIVRSPSRAFWGKKEFRCIIGRGGFLPAEDKTEGDGTTPIGRWLMREVLFRPDREPPPETKLPTRALNPNDAWCETPDNPDYNRLIALPHPAARVDSLWRSDSLYDIVIVLGHNDAPAVPDKGSAIFLHQNWYDLRPSAGCVTLARNDLLEVLRESDAASAVRVAPEP